MTYCEIGSFFWLDDEAYMEKETYDIKWLPQMQDSTFVFSGRAAIDIALQDIMRNRIVKTAYLPSYCCESMVQPFINHGVDVKFYDISFKAGSFQYQIDPDHGCEVALVMSYFGLETRNAHKVIEQLVSQNVTVIEDITHSLLCGESYSNGSDYLVASLRKWFAIPAGGWVAKKKGSLDIKPNVDSNQMVQEKVKGMREKYRYLTGRGGLRENYLALQNTFEQNLQKTDSSLNIDSTSLGILGEIDVSEIISTRRNNAGILQRGLNMENEVLKCADLNVDQDSPLFFPVFLEKENRESLRKYLINNRIYCPVHWPEVHGALAGIRENELSIICDQRYSEEDMQAIVDLIHRWFVISSK